MGVVVEPPTLFPPAAALAADWPPGLAEGCSKILDKLVEEWVCIASVLAPGRVEEVEVGCGPVGS